MTYYSHQDDMLFAMSQSLSGLEEAPTGTGKGTVIARSNFECLMLKSKKIKCHTIVAHRILLSQQLLQRNVEYFLDKGQVPNFARICVHSGDPIEYGKDSLEEQIWLAQYPDHKCGSIYSLIETIEKSIILGQDIVIATTYHSLYKITKALKHLKIKSDISYLDEIHRGVSQDDWFKSLKEFTKNSKRTYAFTATPGKQIDRIHSLVGSTIYHMDTHEAIRRGLICKPMWMIVDVEGNKQQHLAKGVVTAFNEHQKRIDIDAKMLIHCFDSQEIQTIADSFEIRSLVKNNSKLLVAEISSARGARINGKEVDRLDWLKTLNKHIGPMIVIHIDICNSGLDVPGFTFGLWTYMSASETYATQGNGRSGRIVKEDRIRLEKGEITANDYSNWVKPHNICGLLNFSDSLKEDEDAFVDFILKSRDQGFRPEDIVYTSNKTGVDKTDPFDGDAGKKKGYKQSSIQVAISVRLENERLKELLRKTKSMDPMNIFNELV
jgi:superfamily II DNA or RNA helicase